MKEEHVESIPEIQKEEKTLDSKQADSKLAKRSLGFFERVKGF